MASVVFIPYPETGHLNASLKTAKALKAAGHRVTYVGLPDFGDYVASQGLGFAPVFQDLCPKGFVQQQAVGHNMEIFAALLLRAREKGLAFDPLGEMREVVRRAGPDLLVVDLLLPDLARAADAMGVSVLLLNTQLFNPWEERKAFYEPLAHLPELILCPQEFEFSKAGRRENCYFVEASIDLGRRDAPFPWERLDPQKSLVYCSFGSQSHLIDGSREFFRAVVEAVAPRPRWQLALSVGARLRVEEFSPAPPNVIVANSVPQLEVLKRASVMITHGGFNSIKESIFFGVPMINFPVIRDHPAVAARVVYHGLGLRGNMQGTSAEQIRSMIERIEQDGGYKARVEAMGEVFRRMEDEAPGVRIIEGLLENSRAGAA